MTLKYIQAIRGMHDVFPQDAALYRYLETVLIDMLVRYGYNEIRTPVVESTHLFKRAIGTVTDVVEKEMYSFNDRNGESVTLRPEGTAGCVRACIEHGLFYNNRYQEQRLWYIGPMFRRERPQRGRYRQFQQLSVEMFGNYGPGVDAELIMMTARFWKLLGISKYLSLELNSIGSLDSRRLYCNDLSNFLLQYIDILDESARRRLHSNPIRILDTKNKNIQKLLYNAPILTEYLDSESRVHFSHLCELLDAGGVSYIINPRLIRGLDYYNRTVFEWISNISCLGAQNTVCAGGRYDTLVRNLGGYSTPAIGCSVGLDRLFLLISAINSKLCRNIFPNIIDIYIAISHMSDYKRAILLSERIRDILPTIRLYISYRIVNLKKQFRKAYAYGARVALVVGSNKMLKDHVILKDFRFGKQEELVQNLLIDKLLSIFESN
ncbi:histidine--tRNA ligase [Blochmannia endosymbiont of Polyrhachis (Hedomyrma) turneri]|uniref:histidine--tRNA ligase n=1 Tax=Blochmannia endosymbiont of Polyrhachis (Hedomyrma) turneri TaxID=1505596 RepID=UPI00061A7693|nr:histidine--tRNA ligase [Blochmannia endosymbiont of Polyrhachis (Hedomyrma) turneri]AKC60091.1 histidine-tRNA ligase [Blochmannia endosymbiont of Polyrhachis (Hedomyrma) turneri]